MLKRIFCCAMTVCMLAVAVPVMADTTDFDTWVEAGEYMRKCTDDRASEIHFTLSEPEALKMDRNEIIQEFYMMAPFICSSGSFKIKNENGRVDVNITPGYRPGVRMLDAWKSGDMSSLSEDEIAALSEAKSIVERLQSQYSPNSLELERAIVDELCARLTYVSRKEGDDSVIKADQALLNGKANCQGYSEAFYLIAGMAGFNVGFNSGRNVDDWHMWNTIELYGQWYILDLTSIDRGGDLISPETPAYGLFNAGLNRSKDLLSWEPQYETVKISDISDQTYFFYCGIPGFGASFDNLDAMAQYFYNERLYDGERDVWAILSGYGEELPVDELNAAMTRVTNQHNGPTQWHFWGWGCSGQECIMLRWEVF